MNWVLHTLVPWVLVYLGCGSFTMVCWVLALMQEGSLDKVLREERGILIGMWLAWPLAVFMLWAEFAEWLVSKWRNR